MLFHRTKHLYEKEESERERGKLADRQRKSRYVAYIIRTTDRQTDTADLDRQTARQTDKPTESDRQTYS